MSHSTQINITVYDKASSSKKEVNITRLLVADSRSLAPIKNFFIQFLWTCSLVLL